MANLYNELRKAELHLHLEGSIEPETVLQLDPTLQLEDVRSKYAFSDFNGFIRSYIWIARKLRMPADYALVARRLFERLHAENIAYAEITLSAGVILWKEQSLNGVFDALAEETARAEVQVGWVFDAVRQFGAEHAMQVARAAVERKQDGVVAFGIGGDEELGPADWFGDAFAHAKENGLALVPHAGETVGPESVWAAVRLGADRIGHGIRAAEDPELMDHLREHGIPLEICITSNVCTGAVRSIEEHPVRRLYDAGVPITLNTDDPAMFRTTLANEYRIAAERFGFSDEELRGIAANGFRFALAEVER